MQQLFSFEPSQDSNDLPIRRRTLYPTEVLGLIRFRVEPNTFIVTAAAPKVKRSARAKNSRRSYPFFGEQCTGLRGIAQNFGAKGVE